MADLISRLKLESGEFDSKIKRAGQELMAYSEHCRKTGLEMGYANRDAKEFAKALGDMQTTSSTARGKINELSDAFVNLRVMYKNMTDEEKNNQFGKNLAASLDKLKTRINEAKKDLTDVTAELNGAGKASGGGLFGGGKLDGMLQVFGGNLMTKAAGAIANLGSEMADMVKQGVELAKQGEGIRIAFERLGRGDILNGLREATHGTVTDLELMKAAVNFNDFKLPLEELGTMLAFAQQKAKDTGQSVDYMVDSIVTGLGRKSLMILDNLGLSASEIKERMGETGDMTKAVGDIIREQMSKAGDYVETASDRAQQANVEMQNKLEELGRTFAPIQEAGVNMFNRLKLAAIDALNGMRPFFDQFTEAGRIRQQAENMGGGSKVSGQLNRLKVARAAGSDWYVQSSYNNTIKDYEKQISDLNFKIAAFGKGRDAMEKGHIQRLKEQKAAVEQQMKSYQDGAKQYLQPVKAVIDTSGAEQSVTSLTKKLKDLQEQRKKAIAAGDAELSGKLLKQINQTKADIKGLGGSVSTTTTHKATPQERSTEKYEQAERDYRQAVEQAALEMRAGTITQEGQRRKELQAKEALWKAIGDAREIYDTPKLKAAQDKAADEIVRLGGEVKSLSEAEQRAKEAARQLEQAQTKLAEAQQKKEEARRSGDLTGFRAASKTVSVLEEKVERLKQTVDVEPGKVDLPKVPEKVTQKVDVEQGEVNLTEIPEKVTETVDIEQGEVNLTEIPEKVTQTVDVKPGTVKLPEIPGTVTQTADGNVAVGDSGNVSVGTSFIQRVQQDMLEEAQNQDMTAVTEIIRTGLKNGISGMDSMATDMLSKIFRGEDISDDQLKAYVDQLNEKLKEKFDETEWPKVLIKFDADDKSVKKMSNDQKKDASKLSRDWGAAAAAIDSVGDAMNAIRDPADKVMGTIAHAIATVAAGVAKAIGMASDKTTSPWEWLAFATAATAQMVTTIETIHNATGYAEGGLIKGNSYSGDNIPADNFVNAGELVLNRSQQENLAGELRNNDGGVSETTPYLTGEILYLGLNSYLRRAGMGEIMTTKR